MTVLHIVIAMKPIEGNYAENAITNGVAGLNIDASRVGYSGVADKSESCDKQTRKPIGGFSDREGTLYGTSRGIGYKSPEGRFPANVIHDGSDEIKAEFPETTSGKPSGFKRGIKCRGRIDEMQNSPNDYPLSGFGDSGCASRFFKECKI